MAGTFFKQFRAISTDWAIGSFVGASLDFFFNMINSKSHILNSLSALVQLTCATFIVHEFLYALGERKATNTMQGTWILFLSVWTMSPNAVRKLQGTYYAFHRLLYGTGTLVTVPEPKPTEPAEPAESKIECKSKSCQ